VQAHTLGEVGF